MTQGKAIGATISKPHLCTIIQYDKHNIERSLSKFETCSRANNGAQPFYGKHLNKDCSRGMIVLCKRRPYHRLEIVRTLSAAPVSIQIQPSSAPAPYQSCVHQCQIQLSVNIQLILRLSLLVQVIINRNQ